MKRKIIYAVIGVFVIGVIGSVAFVKQAEASKDQTSRYARWYGGTGT